MTKIRKDQKNWPLSPREKKVFDFIVTFITTNEYSPVEVEIAKDLKMTRSNVQDTLVNLIAKGRIKRQPKFANRNIKVVV